VWENVQAPDWRSSTYGRCTALIVTMSNCPSAKGVRASMGAVFRVPIEAGAEVPEGGSRIALVPNATEPVWATDLTGPVVIVVGAERHGLPPDVLERCDATCAIPRAPEAESLNAAQAATLALYEATRQRAASQAESRNGG